MKNTIKWFGVITLVAVMVITAVSCSKSSGGNGGSVSGGGKSLNSAEDLKVYLDSQPANGPDKPIKIAMKLNEPMFLKVRDVLNEAGKYVSLDLSGSPTITIPDNAFYDVKKKEGCKLLAGIIIPKGVTSIGYNAFTGTSLTNVTIPDSVNSIGGGAFYNTVWFNNQPDGLVYVGKVLYVYKGDMPANTSITILDGTKEIGYNAFSGNKNLTNVTIPDSVITIGWGAFTGTSLTNVTIPASVTSIGEVAFYECYSLTSVTFQGTIKESDFRVLDNNYLGYLPPFQGDLVNNYLKGGVGTYTTTTPVPKEKDLMIYWSPVWKKQ